MKLLNIFLRRLGLGYNKMTETGCHSLVTKRRKEMKICFNIQRNNKMCLSERHTTDDVTEVPYCRRARLLHIVVSASRSVSRLRSSAISQKTSSRIVIIRHYENVKLLAELTPLFTFIIESRQTIDSAQNVN